MRRRLLGDTAGGVTKSCPQGYSPEDAVKEVIVKVLEGDRIWDEAKEPSLLNALKGMVRSEIGHLFDRHETSHVEPIDSELPDGSARTADNFRHGGPSPEEELLLAEQCRLEMTALDLIREEAESKPDLEAVFLALYESGDSKDIARLTELPIERVYSARRELERIAAKITPARVARVAKERREK
jgi:hypothetical protein